MKRLYTAAAFVALAAILVPAARVHADSELAVAQPTFYVLAPGGDSSIAPIVHAVVARLQLLFNQASKTTVVWVIPRITWNPDDLFNQCANDPTKTAPGGPRVLGGLILDGTNSFTSNTNSYLLWARGWVKITTHAQLVSCMPTGFAVPTITWISGDVNGYAARNGFPVETGAASALYLGSKADSNAKYIALGATISGFESTTSIPPVDPADETATAAKRVANDLIGKLTDGCKAPSTPITPMCVRLGLATPPPFVAPVATPPPTPAASVKPGESPKPREMPRPRATPD